MTNTYAQIIEYDEMNNTVPPGLWMLCCQKGYQNTAPLALEIGAEKAHIKIRLKLSDTNNKIITKNC